MPLAGLFKQQETVGNGQITESLFNGQYRVIYNGRETIATSQSGMLAVGTTVTLARTAAGLVIISAGRQSVSATIEVIING